MTKRSIADYNPVKFLRDKDLPVVSDDQIDALVRCAGPLPDRTFEVWCIESDGRGVSSLVSARERVRYGFEAAIATYQLQEQQDLQPTSTQLLDTYVTIEAAAKRLLLSLGVGLSGDVSAMPHAIRYGGLSAQATFDLGPNQVTSGTSGDDLLGQALEGVRSLARWAGNARVREERIKARQPASHGRNAGNVALNDYLRTVVTDCWWQVWGREILDTENMRDFIKDAAGMVGVTLTDEMARQRFRRSVKPRRKEI